MRNILRLFNPRLYDLIQPYRVTDDRLMPWAYQEANKFGRTKHDDWGIVSSNQFVKALQPWQNVRRMDCAYRIPLPFRIYGDVKIEERWILWDLGYPTAPGTRVEFREYRTAHGTFSLPHALVEYPGYGRADYSAFIGGEWVPRVFTKYTGKYFGRRLSWYKGLHQDLHVSPPADAHGLIQSDLMTYFPEFALSFVKES